MAKILVADDDPLVVEQIKKSLQRFGHTLVSVWDGKAALKELETEIYDLALLDYLMPGMNGIDILLRQKSRRPEERTPVILMTAHQGTDLIQKAREAGGTDFIAKPFNPRELVSKVMAILKQETRIVCLGGGTGLYTLLMGLKTLSRTHLVSIVSMSDDGGSTGRLREAFGVLPPGDIRRSLIALSTAPQLMNYLLSYRFQKESQLQGHNLGNLILTALSDISGSMQEAVRAVSDILNIRGIVLPVTHIQNRLVAELENGQKVYGETNIDYPKDHDFRLKITKLWQEPETYASPEVLSVIHNADFITLGPGDLFTSLISNLVVKGISEAIRFSPARKIYVSNLMTKPGETYGMSGEEHVEQIIQYLGGDALDYVIFSTSHIPRKMIENYQKQNQEPVRLKSQKRLKSLTHAKVVEADIASTDDHVRHDSYKLAKVLDGIFVSEKRAMQQESKKADKKSRFKKIRRSAKKDRASGRT